MALEGADAVAVIFFFFRVRRRRFFFFFMPAARPPLRHAAAITGRRGVCHAAYVHKSAVWDSGKDPPPQREASTPSAMSSIFFPPPLRYSSRQPIAIGEPEYLLLKTPPRIGSRPPVIRPVRLHECPPEVLVAKTRRRMAFFAPPRLRWRYRCRDSARRREAAELGVCHGERYSAWRARHGKRVCGAAERSGV